MNELTQTTALHCANCGTPMQGEFCHHCGQSVHSVLKPVHHMVEDTLDMVLHVDGRIVHTLPPLLLKPGFLTLEYFAGRRQRYVAPFRLMFVLCLLAFFLAHLAVGDGRFTIGTEGVTVQNEAFKKATTPAQVQSLLQQQLAGLDQATRASPGIAQAGLAQARLALEQQAARRRLELGDKTVVMVDAPAKDSGSAATGQSQAPVPVAPVHIGWLPAFANTALTHMKQRIKANGKAMLAAGEAGVEARQRLMAQLFATLPQTLFFMLPVFALLLKLFYVFRRRLYMEHLIVALHSHAFLFLALLLGVLLAQLQVWLVPHAGWTAPPLHGLVWVLALWVPGYLLVMQKRVYRQSWPVTVLKYLAIGWCYLWLLLGVLTAAFLLSLAH